MKKRRPGDGSKMVGAGHSIKSKENHHWWPKGISKLWCDKNGQVNKLASSGDVITSDPKSFGMIKNAHKIDLNGPWTSTIEPIFDHVDCNLPRLVAKLMKEEPSWPSNESCLISLIQKMFKLSMKSAGSFDGRIAEFPLLINDTELLGEGMCALLVRSPGFRHQILQRINYTRVKRSGMEPIGPRDDLIAAQIDSWYNGISEELINSSKVILYSPDKELIMGEGYLNNIGGSSETLLHRVVIPLTPTLAVFSYSGLGPIKSRCVHALKLTKFETEELNYITQVCSKSSIFFRCEKPNVREEFSKGEFLQFTNAKHQLLEDFISVMHTDRAR